MYLLSYVEGKFHVFRTENLLVLYFLSSLAQVDTSKPLHKTLNYSQSKCIFDLLSTSFAWFRIFHMEEFAIPLSKHFQGWNSFIK